MTLLLHRSLLALILCSTFALWACSDSEEKPSPSQTTLQDAGQDAAQDVDYDGFLLHEGTNLCTQEPRSACTSDDTPNCSLGDCNWCMCQNNQLTCTQYDCSLPIDQQARCCPVEQDPEAWCAGAYTGGLFAYGQDCRRAPSGGAPVSVSIDSFGCPVLTLEGSCQDEQDAGDHAESDATDDDIQGD